MPQSNTTQDIIDIKEIRDGVIVLKNGALRAVLMASSVNFSLKSSEEQDAILYGYQSFLNSLDFPAQVVITSRGMKVDAYIDKLKKIEKNQTNDLLKMQTAEYADFIKQLVEMSNIMSKNFYVAVPFSMAESKQGGIMEKIGAILNPKSSSTASDMSFQKAKDQLMQRVDLVSSSLKSIGVQTAILGTEEAIELFYSLYNPGMEKKEMTGELENIAIENKF